ncbi:MAG TPA: helix-turn-helix domain-containing protein [Firmicutes bacterium]|nr:helix-turn-helix domain-containing protein [Bacillota bacterium]
MDKKAVGRRIKQLRKQKGLTQEEIAELLGLSTTYYAAVEQGTSFPRLDNLVAIINCIGASADQIFMDVIDHAYPARSSELEEKNESIAR